MSDDLDELPGPVLVAVAVPAALVAFVDGVRVRVRRRASSARCRALSRRCWVRSSWQSRQSAGPTSAGSPHIWQVMRPPLSGRRGAAPDRRSRPRTRYPTSAGPRGRQHGTDC